MEERLALVGFLLGTGRRLSTRELPDQMDLVQAMERLKRAITDDAFAAAAGVSTNMAHHSRANPLKRNCRPAPAG